MSDGACQSIERCSGQRWQIEEEGNAGFAIVVTTHDGAGNCCIARLEEADLSRLLAHRDRRIASPRESSILGLLKAIVLSRHGAEWSILRPDEESALCEDIVEWRREGL